MLPRPFILGFVLSSLMVVDCTFAGMSDEREIVSPLTSAKAIRSLSFEEAKAGHAVLLEGVVLQGVRQLPQALVLWDGEEGIYIEGRDVFSPDIRAGDVIVVKGYADPGTFAPMVRATSVRIVGRSSLPDPIKTSVSEVAAGGYDATWLELEAIVQGFVAVQPTEEEIAVAGEAPVEPVWILHIKGGDSQIQLRLEADMDVSPLLDAKVRFTGICYSLHNPNRQFVRAAMVVNGADFVEIITPAPRVEDLPVTPIDKLLQFSQSGYSGHRVKVQGVLTHHEPGRAMWIRGDGRGLEVATTQDTDVTPGDIVEVVGFAEHGRYAPRLTDAEFRKVARQEPPLPQRINRAGQTVAHEANLIEIEGELVDIQESDDVSLFTMTWEEGTFQGVLVARYQEQLPRLGLNQGSRLRLAGICTRVPQSLAPQIGIWRIEEFQVLLRSADDIEVVRSGPWLTESRAVYILAIGAGLLVLVIFAIVVSARRAIASRGVERQMAEAEFSAMLKERNRVARDIHDTLAQGLNAVSMQLELAKNTSGNSGSKSHTHVETAHQIVRSCIAEARESIWNMRSHVLDQTDLPGALEIVLQQLGAPHGTKCRLEIEGKRRRLAPRIENDVLRVGQEAIANALKHAQAMELVVKILFRPNRIRLLVIDDGVGFDPESAQVTTSHFGLSGMRERVDQLQGSLEILSRRGGGTVLSLEVGGSGRSDTSNTL